MHARAHLHEEAPPESGVRLRVRVLDTRGAKESPRLSSERDVLREVGEEVFFEVLGVVRALSPLQGPWLKLSLPQLASAAVEVSTWPLDTERPARLFRERWHELVPGSSSIDRLAHLMVDAICS